MPPYWTALLCVSNLYQIAKCGDYNRLRLRVIEEYYGQRMIARVMMLFWFVMGTEPGRRRAMRLGPCGQLVVMTGP